MHFLHCIEFDIKVSTRHKHGIIELCLEALLLRVEAVFEHLQLGIPLRFQPSNYNLTKECKQGRDHSPAQRAGYQCLYVHTGNCIP